MLQVEDDKIKIKPEYVFTSNNMPPVETKDNLASFHLTREQTEELMERAKAFQIENEQYDRFVERKAVMDVAAECIKLLNRIELKDYEFDGVPMPEIISKIRKKLQNLGGKAADSGFSQAAMDYTGGSMNVVYKRPGVEHYMYRGYAVCKKNWNDIDWSVCKGDEVLKHRKNSLSDAFQWIDIYEDGAKADEK